MVIPLRVPIHDNIAQGWEREVFAWAHSLFARSKQRTMDAGFRPSSAPFIASS